MVSQGGRQTAKLVRPADRTGSGQAPPQVPSLAPRCLPRWAARLPALSELLGLDCSLIDCPVIDCLPAALALVTGCHRCQPPCRREMRRRWVYSLPTLVAHQGMFWLCCYTLCTCSMLPMPRTLHSSHPQAPAGYLHVKGGALAALLDFQAFSLRKRPGAHQHAASACCEPPNAHHAATRSLLPLLIQVHSAWNWG